MFAAFVRTKPSPVPHGNKVIATRVRDLRFVTCAEVERFSPVVARNGG